MLERSPLLPPPPETTDFKEIKKWQDNLIGTLKGYFEGVYDEFKTMDGVGFPANLTIEGDLSVIGEGSIEGDANFASNVNIDGDVNIGGGFKLNDVSVAGWLTDDTPFYIKELSITITDTNTYASVAHGIANASTNNKIFGWCARYSGDGYVESGTSVTADIHIYKAHWGDTNFEITRGGTSGNRTFIVSVWYK
jgi:hypothetical protein